MAGFEVGRKYTNERGAWVILHNDPNGGQYYSGVWYAEVYAPDFPEGKKSSELSSNKNRARVERGMRQWLASR